MEIGNIFEHTSPPREGERFDTLLSDKGLVIERILSSSRIESPLYVQQQDEWVVLLRGEAVLEVRGNAVRLEAGDYLFLPSTTPHKVLSVSEGALWLAVHHYSQPSSA